MGAYFEKCAYGWGNILEEVVTREVGKISSKKRRPLASFIYHRHGVLIFREKEEWRSRQELIPVEPPLDREEELVEANRRRGPPKRSIGTRSESQRKKKRARMTTREAGPLESRRRAAPEGAELVAGPVARKRTNFLWTHYGTILRYVDGGRTGRPSHTGEEGADREKKVHQPLE